MEKRESDQFAAWAKYQKNVELNMQLNILPREMWKTYLLSVAGPFIQELERLLPPQSWEDEDREDAVDEYDEFVSRLKEHFKPK